MGAFCGKAAGEEEHPNAPLQKPVAGQQRSSVGEPGAKAQDQMQIAPPVGTSVDEHDIHIHMNGDNHAAAAASEGDQFNAPDATKMANGEEAYSFWDRNRTYKPERQLPQGSKASQLQHTMQATMRATLGGGQLEETVKLPEGEDLNEWIAVNTVHFFNAASMIYGTCSQFCTDASCPTMSAGKAEYLWKDSVNYKKPTHVSAPVYIDLLLSWADERISNPILFPVEQNAKFPRQFLSEVRQIYKRLFRLYAHLYCSHSEKIRSIGANAHLNTCFKHFVYFILEFNLMSAEEMQPLDKLIQKLKEAKKRS